MKSPRPLCVWGHSSVLWYSSACDLIAWLYLPFPEYGNLSAPGARVVARYSTGRSKVHVQSVTSYSTGMIHSRLVGEARSRGRRVSAGEAFVEMGRWK